MKTVQPRICPSSCRALTHSLLIGLIVVSGFSLQAKNTPSAHAVTPSHDHHGSPTSKADPHSTMPSVDAETSLRWLINGNQRFVRKHFRSDGHLSKDVQRLSSGQSPHAIVLSCSDSRVPPEIVFDQKLGEIFVVRTAGQALGDNVIGSIEYAVEHLGSKLIVVMGHTSCGAVKAALSTMDGQSAGSPALDGLVKDMHPRLERFKGTSPSKHVHKESTTNAQQVAKDLIERSKILKGKVASGELKIVSSIYDLETGNVVFNSTDSREKKRALSSESQAH
jgi:carbonic anhydrase